MSELLVPEMVQGVSLFIPFAIAALGFSFRQREAIRKRDHDACQSYENGIRHGGKLQIHHILPKRFAEKVLGMKPEEYNTAENAITLCTNHHTGHPHSVHPDMHKALWEYRNGDRDAINRMIEERENKIKEGRIYWNNEHDGEFREIARRNTVESSRGGWVFPKVNGKR